MLKKAEVVGTEVGRQHMQSSKNITCSEKGKHFVLVKNKEPIEEF